MAFIKQVIKYKRKNMPAKSSKQQEVKAVEVNERARKKNNSKKNKKKKKNRLATIICILLLLFFISTLIISTVKLLKWNENNKETSNFYY